MTNPTQPERSGFSKIKGTRRKFIQGSSVALAAAGMPWLQGCAEPSIEDLPPLPSGLPQYSYDGVKGPDTMFEFGIASGDPTQSAVILWTHVSPGDDAASVDVFYEVALDPQFQYRVAAGWVTTDADSDFTAKVDATGLGAWGRQYFYRFTARGVESAVGRTRLAPESSQRVRFGIVSCSNFAYGEFFVYEHMAARNDIDAVLHLGDYIYEYGTGRYGDYRECDPPHEIVTLDDYRTRYAQYRSDPRLQQVHAAHPFINIWDDHETADNSYKDGANNHNPDEGEGDWTERKLAARQAYDEWLPIRVPATEPIYRKIAYGNLVDLYMLDTRIEGRDQELTSEEFDDDQINTPARHILGETQEQWLKAELGKSSARWQVFGQQVMLGHFIQSNGEIYNGDQWDGYPYARERFLDILRPYTGSNVVLTGDIHSSWAIEVADDPYAGNYDPASDNVAVEFVCSAVSSPGFPGGNILTETFLETNPHMKFINLWQRGMIVLDIDQDRVQADYYLVDGVEEGEGQLHYTQGIVARHGDPQLELVETDVLGAPADPLEA